MKPTFRLPYTGIRAENKADDNAMTPTLPAAGEDAPADVEPKAETLPSRKRGTFLSGRLFGGKDKDSTAQPGEKIGPQALIPAPTDSVAENPALAVATETVEPASLPKFVALEPLASKLAVTSAPAPLATPSAPAADRPRPFMTSDHTMRPADDSRALAELTIGFEVSALQLTPYFKLGALELTTLSNVVSLRLITARPDGHPLAAGISFQIEQVDLDDASHLKSVLLKPLGESHELAAPGATLQVDHVAMMNPTSDAPIAVTAAAHVTTAVQVFGSFTVAEIDFSPAFEISSLRLAPASNTVRVRVAPASLPVAQDPSLSFEVAEVKISDSAQMIGARLLPLPIRNA